MIPKVEHIHLDEYSESGEWSLETTNVVEEEIYHDVYPGVPFPKVTFNMFLKRKFDYFMLNIIGPCFMLVMMTIFLFWLPCDSGERVSLGITILLAFSVFQLILAEITPKTSDFIPYVSKYSL